MTNKSISDAFARNKTHTVAAIAEAKEESNRYTDTQVISAKSYSDTNLASAKTYTNESIANYEEVQSGVNVQLSNQISQVDNKVEQLNQSLGSAAHQESEYFTNYADGAAAGALSEANKHAEEYADEVKNSLLNGAGDAYDTLKELGELIDDNTDAIGALEIIATNKADKVHEHSIADITDADKKVNSPVDQQGNVVIGTKDYVLISKGDGSTEWAYQPKIYIGSEDLPEGYDIKLDPNAPSLEIDDSLTVAGAVADAKAVGDAIRGMATLYSGASEPDASLGKDGDYYILYTRVTE